MQEHQILARSCETKMTIHFRSRIQSPIQHTDKLFPDGYRGCCCTGDVGSVPFESTLGECNALDGYFRYSLNNCNYACPPKGQTGCCCACSLGGMTSGVEECTCEDLGGVWVEGNCSNQNADVLCIATNSLNGVTTDVRKKSACCGITLQGGVTTAYCEEVCTPFECEDNTITGYRSNYFVNVNSCSSIQNLCSLSPPQVPLTSPPKDTLEDYVYGNCCLQGTLCRCLRDVTLKNCSDLNGSFYLLGEPEYDCSMCYKNCSKGRE